MNLGIDYMFTSCWLLLFDKKIENEMLYKHQWDSNSNKQNNVNLIVYNDGQQTMSLMEVFNTRLFALYIQVRCSGNFQNAIKYKL